MSSMISESNKENQSENMYTSASSDYDCNFKNPFLKIRFSNSLKLDDSLSQSHDESKELNEDHKQIVESMQRRFKLQLKKQKQFFEIVQTKLKQENEILFEQAQSLKQQNKQLVSKAKQSLLSAQSMGKEPQEGSRLVLSQVGNLRNMLSNLQKEHQNCISGKKELIDQKQTLEMKVIILERENKQLEAESRELRRKLQSFTEIQTQNSTLKNELQLLRKEVISLRVLNQEQEKQFCKQLSSLQKAIEEINSKTTLPEIAQKLISFSNEQLQQSALQPNFKNSMNFIQLKPQLQTISYPFEDVPFSSSSNRFPSDSFRSGSLADSTLCYSAQNHFDETSIIQGLYKKNLSILNQKFSEQNNHSISTNSRFNHLDYVENIKPERTFKKSTSKLQKPDNNFPSSARQLTSLSKVSSINRRFRYL